MILTTYEIRDGWVYTRVSPTWHKLKTPAGLFFASTRELVFMKAVMFGGKHG